ncbi:MAG: flagellar biosynthetic protein FliO [Firmicutes bacterium]|nr:flagellar biosynthetic protein FliO [Bacillota bacterium]
MNLIDGEMLLGFIKVVIVLACLTPLIYLITRWYGKFHSINRSVTVREKTSLGANKALLVVEWEGNRYLLAVTNQQVSVIDKKAVSGDAPPVPAAEKGGEPPFP